jgi:AcrR family transcriptional regulator
MDPSSIVRRPPFGANPLVGERGSDTQRRILVGALEVFAEVGFADARVELITERAGCSRPAFYQYFSSKDDVFWRLAEELGREMVHLADQLPKVTRDAAGLAALAAWIDAFIDLYAAYAPVFNAFQTASREHQPVARRSSGISDRTGDALLRAFGARRTARTGTLVTSLVAVLIRCSFYAEALAGALGRQALVDGVAQMVHRTFWGPVEGVNLVRTRRRASVGAADAMPDPPSRSARPLRPRGEQTRRRLLDAGATVLPSRGYHDARVDDIVATAGVSHGTFYRYFENKDDFFLVLAEGAAGDMIELLDRVRFDADAPVLRTWLDDWFAMYSSNGGVISTWQEMPAAAELGTFSRQVAAAVIARLERELRRRDFGDPAVDALTLLALVERIPYSVFTLGFSDQPAAVEATLTIIQRGFLALPEPR